MGRSAVMGKFFGAVAILCGTIIGVGVFGLPYVAAQSGVTVVLAYLLWGTIVATTTALAFGELTYRTAGLHRAPGYIAFYLGKRWGRLALVSALGGLFGGQLVYLLVGGQFLHQLLGGGGRWPQLVTVLAYAVIGGLIIRGTDRGLARSELILLPLFLGSMVLVVTKTLPAADPTLLDDVNWSRLLFPYGVVMFSIWGQTAVAECRDFLGAKYAWLLRRAILTSFPFCAAAYAMFATTIAIATGPNTTPDALGGLQLLLGHGLARWFYLFGVLTTFTSYISFGITIRNVLHYDAALPKTPAWGLSAAVPIVLYLSGVTNFLLLMGLIGALSLGFDAVSTLLAYQKAAARPAVRALPYRLNLSRGGLGLLLGLITIGSISTVVSLIW